MITHERLLELLDYNPDTGLFFWKVRTGPRCKLDQPLGIEDSSGYLHAKIDNHTYRLHRLAWYYVTGTWPENDIDHRDEDKTNNRYKNLRKATRSQNCCNKSKGVNNTSGYKGVSFHKASGKYAAQIMVNKKPKWLGLFTTPIEAHGAYCEAAKAIHNDFANKG